MGTRWSVVGIFSLAVAMGAATLASPVQAQTELIVNGSFEVDGAGFFGGDITGWTLVAGSLIEILPPSSYGVTGQDGDLVVELNGDGPFPNTRIRQTVATTPGLKYTLKFRAAARSGTLPESNQMNVYWGGALLSGSPITSSSTVMTEYTYTVVATGSSMDVEFEATGPVDTLGTILDAVSLKVVCFEWSGVLQPVNADGSSIFKAGSTIPVKFKLTGEDAGNTSLVAHITYAKINGIVVGTVNEAATNVGGDTGNTFRYDPTSDQYIYNWTTKGLTAGTYRIFIDLGDDCIHTVDVALK
jgi:hypothetical protein